jgi:hypothetical protein
MLPFLGFLFKNPIAKLVVDKTIGAIQHNLEVKKLERVAEIEAAKTVQVQQVISSEKSWKDEYLTIVFTCCVSCTLYTTSYAIHGTRLGVIKVSSIRVLVGYINYCIWFFWYEHNG